MSLRSYSYPFHQRFTKDRFSLHDRALADFSTTAYAQVYRLLYLPLNEQTGRQLGVQIVERFDAAVKKRPS